MQCLTIILFIAERIVLISSTDLFCQCNLRTLHQLIFFNTIPVQVRASHHGDNLVNLWQIPQEAWI